MHGVDTLTLGMDFRGLKQTKSIHELLIQKLKGRYREEYNSVCYSGLFDGYSYFYIAVHYYLLITLQNSNIKDFTDTEIIKNTIKHIEDYFTIPSEYIPKTALNRMEYMNNYRLKKPEQREIIIDICEIAIDQIFTYVKKIHEDRFINYESESNKVVSIIVYDKAGELLRKGDIKGAMMYKNIIRTEVKIKKRKLSNESPKRSRELDSYYNEEMGKFYFDFYISKIFFKEPFYRIDKAIEVINNAEFKRPTMKEKLIKLLEDILKNGYTQAMREYGGEAKFRRHIKRIRDLGINPLTFSSKYETEIMDNFTLLENGVSDEDLRLRSSNI